MATFATARRIRHRHADGRPRWSRPPAVGVSGLSVSLASHTRQAAGERTGRAAGHRRGDGALEAIGTERNRLAGQTRAHRGGKRKHHGGTGVYREPPVETLTARRPPYR